MKFAYFGFPHLGGTYSVFRNLRQGLGPADIDLRWMAADASAHAASATPFFRSETGAGHLVGKQGDDERAQAHALCEAVTTGGYDGVFVNVLADRVQTNLARYLPSALLRIMIVHNITPGTYAPAAAIRDHVHATVAIAPRIASDLVERHGFPRERVVTIPHGIDCDAFAAWRRERKHGSVRVLFLGRIEDQAKGVFWLPAILARLDPGVRMTVAGEGPSLPALKAMMGRLADRVDFLGAVTPERASRLFASHDILLMPSRFEGFGLVLAEAMATGCVPVASHIRGVTDAMVETGRNGMLFPIGDVPAAATAINRLARDSALWFSMSGMASLTVRQSFSIPKCACAYLDLIDGLVAEAPAIAAPLPLSDWNYPLGLKGGLRSHAPVWMKNAWRRWKERPNEQSDAPAGRAGGERSEGIRWALGHGLRKGAR